MYTVCIHNRKGGWDGEIEEERVGGGKDEEKEQGINI